MKIDVSIPVTITVRSGDSFTGHLESCDLKYESTAELGKEKTRQLLSISITLLTDLGTRITVDDYGHFTISQE